MYALRSVTCRVAATVIVESSTSSTVVSANLLVEPHH